MKNLTIHVTGFFLLLWSLVEYFIPEPEEFRWVFPLCIGIVGLYMMLSEDEEVKI